MMWWWRRELRILREQIVLAAKEPRADFGEGRRDLAAYRAVKRSGCHTLDDWLAVATWQLSDYAKLRIREEVKEHYADAVDGLDREGRSERAAEEAPIGGQLDTFLFFLFALMIPGAIFNEFRTWRKIRPMLSE